MAAPTELTHTPAPPVAADVAPKASDGTVPETVQTQWSINYETLFPGAKEQVRGRTPDDALYLKDFKVAPAGAPGGTPPIPHLFKGTDLSRSGVAQLGGLAHPKGRGGKVSAGLAFGKRPEFGFTLASSTLKGGVAQAAHREIADAWAEKLDGFISEQDAVALLQDIIVSRYPDGSVTAKVTRKDHAGAFINATDFKYGSVDADRTFNLKVVTPTTTKDHAKVTMASRSGEYSHGSEANHQEGTGTEVSSSTATERQLTNQVKGVIDAGLNSLARTIVDSGLNTDVTTSHVGGDSTKIDGGMSLKTVIDGGLDFNPGDLLKGIPAIGPLLSKIGNAKLNVHVEPNYNTDIALNWNNSSETLSKIDSHSKTETAKDVATYVKNQTETLMNTSLKTAIAVATKFTTTGTSGGKDSDGRKDNGSTSVTETVGTVDVVKTTLQPALIEE